MISRKHPNALSDGLPSRPLLDRVTDRSYKDPFWIYCLLVLGAGLYLFLISDRSINLYDQGIALTNVARVGAGLVVHRDFYYNYGPAGLYLGAATFKLFGRSVLSLSVEGIVEQALTALFFYICARRLSNPRIALAAFVASILWSETLGVMTLFTLWPTWLLMDVFDGDAPARRVYIAGLMTGFTTLLRYDIGFGLAGTLTAVIFVAGILRYRGIRRSVARSTLTAAVFLGGWATLIVPLFAVYYAVGALPGFLYDIVRYPAKYYHMSRNLPFPRVHPRLNFEDIVVYLFPLLIAVSFYAVARWWSRSRRFADEESVPPWIAALVSFGAIAAVMYVKGLVRISAGSLFMCAGACILLGVVLYAHRAVMSLFMRATTVLLLIAIAIGGITATSHTINHVRDRRSMMLAWLLRPSTQAPYGSHRSWCSENNPLSKDACYFPDNDHIDAIRYIVANTKPGDTLYVGLPSHDRILINDNLTYFATQRLPATKWSHFDPFLQTRADIQQQMIQDLEKNRPPYVILDSEFDQDAEPNGSSVHTGVHLLDDYIATHYSSVQRFGEMTILKRNQAGE